MIKGQAKRRGEGASQVRAGWRGDPADDRFVRIRSGALRHETQPGPAGCRPSDRASDPVLDPVLDPIMAGRDDRAVERPAMRRRAGSVRNDA